MKKRGLLLTLLLIGCIRLSAQQVLEQRVSLRIQQQPLAEVFYQLIEVGGIPISFRNDVLPVGKFTFQFSDRPLREVLDAVLTNTGLMYQVQGQQVLIVSKPLPAYASISGYVTDAETGERLIGAGIQDAISLRGTTSNEYGYFSLSLPTGSVQLVVTYLGYEPHRAELTLAVPLKRNVALKGSITLNEVIVYARDTLADPIGGLATGNLIGLRETQLLPSLAGEPDIFRTAHLLPGVTTGADGAEGIQVRGGDGGQNLVLLDGVPVYYVNHAIGLFSVFNSNAVRSAQLLRGGFPARYAGRLSSVLDVRMKEGNRQKTTGSAEAGLLSTRFLLEGPLVQERSSFLVSGRWSFVHTFLVPESRKFKERNNTTGQTDYRFYDLNAKLNYSVSQNDHLYLSFYKGRDRYDDNTDRYTPLELIGNNGMLLNFDFDQSYAEGLTWGNTVGSLRWNHLFSSRLFSNFSVTYSGLDQESFYNLSDILTEPSIGFSDSVHVQGLFQSGIQDVGAKADVQWLYRHNLSFRAGAGANRRVFNPGALIVNEPLDDNTVPFQNNTIYTTELTAYIEGQGQWHSRWNWNAGLHAAWWYVRGQGTPNVQPRLSINYAATPRWTLNASWSRMVQPLHFLRNTTLNLPTEIWVPSTDRIAPATAALASVGWRHDISPQWQWTGDVYYKKMNRLVAFLEGVEGFRNWEENVAVGQGQSYGAELQLNKVAGRLTGWVSYTLSRADRQFDALNLGRAYPFRYDRRHNVQLAAVYQITRGLYASANWGYSTGFALTLPLVKFSSVVPGELPPPGGLPFVLDPEAKNNVRMPANHRLDVNVHYSWQKNKWEHTLNLGVYNVYNRNNPLYYDVRRFLVNQNNVLATRYQFVEVQLTPLLPTLSYRIGF